METKENYIDELTRNALSGPEPSSNDASLWSRIDNTMKYKRFLRFSLNTFNVYYSAAILLITVSSAVYFFANNNSQNTSPVYKNKSIQPAPPSASSSQPCLPDRQAIDGENIQNEPTEKPNTNSLPAIKNETENSTASTVNSKPKSAKKVMIVKKQYVITDTILKKNTVIIRKPYISK